MNPSIQPNERRRSARQTVLKRAHLVAGDLVYDCVVMDSSALGARISTGSFVPLPENIELRFSSGASLQAVVRWSRGAEVGLEFATDGASLRAEAADLAWSAYEHLRGGRFDRALNILKTERFFDDPVLRATGVEAEEAYGRLEAAVRQRAQAPDARPAEQAQISWW